MKRGKVDERTRVGLCAGCRIRAAATPADATLQRLVLQDQPLYRVGDLQRWRCDTCYRAEVGTHP